MSAEEIQALRFSLDEARAELVQEKIKSAKLEDEIVDLKKDLEKQITMTKTVNGYLKESEVKFKMLDTQYDHLLEKVLDKV